MDCIDDFKRKNSRKRARRPRGMPVSRMNRFCYIRIRDTQIYTLLQMIFVSFC
jgi:hypothetical protein